MEGSSSSFVLSVDSSQILSLIQHHLVESSLLETSKALLHESGIGPSGLLPVALSNLKTWIRNGEWGSVLEILSTLTPNTSTSTASKWRQILSEIHEIVILELGELGDMDLAFATLRVCTEHFDQTCIDNSSLDEDPTHREKYNYLVTNHSIEQRLQALSAARSLHLATNLTSGHYSSGQTRMGYSDVSLPVDYYGPNSISKQKRRDDIAHRIGSILPIVPPARLTVLLQQSIKWQSHTGQLPMIQKLLETESLEDTRDSDNAHEQSQEMKRKKKKTKKRKTFDLVLGVAEVDEPLDSGFSQLKKGKLCESNPTEPYSYIKLSKKTVVESCTFLSSITHPSLITGSSDGFIEIWDSETNYTSLRTHDLPYQARDELMCHDDGVSILALKVSKDSELLASGDSQGTIMIWKLSDGTVLREFRNAHGGAVSCLDFSQDSSKVLSASQDSTCREFGLRANRMLREFRGHSSFVNYCAYVMIHPEEKVEPSLIVLSASADGTIRIWDYRSTEVKYILSLSSTTGVQSYALDSASFGQHIGTNIHTILPLHTPSNTFIAVGRMDKAYLLNFTGELLRIYNPSDNSNDSNVSSDLDLVTAVISPSNKWLYVVSQKGIMTCFDVSTGKVHKSILDFGIQCTSGAQSVIAMTGLVHHPYKGIIGAYSRDPSQKRGLLTLWR